MSKKDSRPQTPKQPLKVEVKTALPWTIIVIATVAGVSFVGGWMQRSAQVTMTDVNYAISQQLEEVKTDAKK